MRNAGLRCRNKPVISARPWCSGSMALMVRNDGPGNSGIFSMGAMSAMAFYIGTFLDLDPYSPQFMQFPAFSMYNNLHFSIATSCISILQ